MTKRFLIYTLPVAVAACGGGDGNNGSLITAPVQSAPTATPSPTATATVTPAPTPSASATPTYGTLAATVDFTTGTNAAYATKPDVPNCRTGTLNSSVTTNVVAKLNEIRAFHRLPAVTFSSTDQEAAMQAALMMTANNALNHTPPTSWKCYTSVGSAGAGSSNLYGSSQGPGLSYQSDEALLAGWLTEIENISVDNVGHRRWLLNPFLGTIAYGRVAGLVDSSNRGDAAALKVFNNAGQGGALAGLPAFVAYPYGDYPAKYFDTRALLSFTVVTDGSSAFGANANVDFSRATVTVTGPSGALTVSSVTYDNLGYGVANNIQWKTAGLQIGTNYTVAINGVTVRGAATNYSYTFRVLN